MNSPLASIVFPTRNRRDILLEAIAAAFAQSVPVEILVLDDGSTDGSAEAVAERFPGKVAYHRIAEGRGPAFQRNRGVELARTAVVFALDDDSILSSTLTVEQTLREFDYPRVGAVGIPFVDVRKANHEVQQRAPDAAHVWVEHAFVGAAHAVRRDVFLAVGGYREELFYMGEEGDLTLRMLAKGWVTRLGLADPIEHHESPNRVTARANFYGRRNDVLFAWHNVPWPYLPFHMAGTLINGLKTAATEAEHPWRMAAGLLSGLSGCHRSVSVREPVSKEIYLLSRKLKKGGALPLDQIAAHLPSISLG